ncbi:MAG: hypothetical protein ABIY55_11625 [Kofleriaceae bacterium]
MIEDLLAVIDRSWSVLDSQRGVGFALACFPFRDQLLRDARTAQMLDDLRRENQESISALMEATEVDRASMLAVFVELVAQRPDVIPTAADQHGYDRRPDAIRRRLEKRQPDADDDAWGIAQEHEDDGRLGQAVAIVKDLIGRTDLDALRERVNVIEQSVGFARRARHIYYLTGPGASLARVERDLADLHPPVADPNSHSELARMCRVKGKPLGRVYDVIFKNERVMRDSGEAREIDGAMETLRADMRRIVEEIRRRLGAERSLLSLVHRYQQKCQWYDAERLRALAASGTGTPEDRLSETLATYLFDHGLNPLTRPLLGRILPDILNVATPFSFYVEAKQYRQGAPGYLLRGMQQVWDMLDHLRGSGHDVREAFYVIYRRGGPRYSFPPRVQHRDRVVHIVVVDISATNERGSNAPATRTFDVAELVPAVAIPNGANGVMSRVPRSGPTRPSRSRVPTRTAPPRTPRRGRRVSSRP